MRIFVHNVMVAVDEIVNKVSSSGLVTINLEDFYQTGERVLFDLRPHLFQELILKEKDFREFVGQHVWNEYEGKLVAITCSADAIVPTWAYMLLSIALQPYARQVYFGNLLQLEEFLFVEKLANLDIEQYRGKRVVIKGCGDIPIPTNAFVMLASKIKPIAKSIMYGEPCSTVPLFKSK